MSDDKVIALNTPENMDALQEVLKQGARKLLEQAIEAELADLLERHTNLVTADGKRAVVRNGYLPERTIQTGLGDISVKVPKVRDRSKKGVKFNSELVPPLCVNLTVDNSSTR